MKPYLNSITQKEKVLTQAILKLASFYDFSGKDLHQIIGLSEATITRLNQGKAFLSPSTKEGEIAVLLLRVYRGLQSLLGNNHEKAKLWLYSDNVYFKGKPFDQLKTISGLLDTVRYIDAMRGKL